MPQLADLPKRNPPDGRGRQERGTAIECLPVVDWASARAFAGHTSLHSASPASAADALANAWQTTSTRAWACVLAEAHTHSVNVPKATSARSRQEEERASPQELAARLFLNVTRDFRIFSKSVSMHASKSRVQRCSVSIASSQGGGDWLIARPLAAAQSAALWTAH